MVRNSYPLVFYGFPRTVIRIAEPRLVQTVLECLFVARAEAPECSLQSIDANSSGFFVFYRERERADFCVDTPQASCLDRTPQALFHVCSRLVWKQSRSGRAKKLHPQSRSRCAQSGCPFPDLGHRARCRGGSAEDGSASSCFAISDGFYRWRLKRKYARGLRLKGCRYAERSMTNPPADRRHFRDRTPHAPMITMNVI